MSLNIGDRVIVRYWDDMASEYTEDVDYAGRSYLNIPQGFLREMEYFCGNEYIVSITGTNEEGRYYYLESDGVTMFSALFSEEMLVRVNEDDSDIDTSMIDDFIGGISCEV